MSALAVVVFHVAAVTKVTSVDGPGRYLANLNVGVSVFFVLSGFLLYRPFVAARLLDTPIPATGAYLWRRVLRIFPAYWLVLTVVAFGMHQTDLGSLFHVALYYGLLNGYTVATVIGGLFVAWSLGTEVSFYAYLPAHAWCLRRWSGSFSTRVRSEYAVCAGLCVLSIGWKVVILHAHTRLGYSWLPAYLDTFALGMALAVTSVAAGRSQRASGVVRAAGAFSGRVWVAALLVYLTACNQSFPVGLFDPITASQYLTRQTLLSLTAVLLVAPVVLVPEGGGAIRQSLAAPPARWLGRISYGIFLWHLPLLDELNRHLRRAGQEAAPYFLLLVATLVATVVAAQLTWWLVEHPALRCKERGPGRRLVVSVGSSEEGHRRTGMRSTTTADE